MLKTIADKRAALLRGHGIVVAGQNLPEVLYTSFVLEDDAKKSWQAASLGEVGTISEEVCRAFGAEIALDRCAQRAWNYFCSLEARWDHQPNTGKSNYFRKSDKYCSNGSKRSKLFQLFQWFKVKLRNL